MDFDSCLGPNAPLDEQLIYWWAPRARRRCARAPPCSVYVSRARVPRERQGAMDWNDPPPPCPFPPHSPYTFKDSLKNPWVAKVGRGGLKGV